jgi:hypothetical protein
MWTKRFPITHCANSNSDAGKTALIDGHDAARTEELK